MFCIMNGNCQVCARLRFRSLAQCIATPVVEAAGRPTTETNTVANGAWVQNSGTLGLMLAMLCLPIWIGVALCHWKGERSRNSHVVLPDEMDPALPKMHSRQSEMQPSGIGCQVDLSAAALRSSPVVPRSGCVHFTLQRIVSRLQQCL